MVLIKRGLKNALDNMRKWAVRYSVPPADALKWDQIIWMAVVGLAIWVLVQNDSNVQNFMASVITTVQDTLTQMLTSSY